MSDSASQPPTSSTSPSTASTRLTPTLAVCAAVLAVAAAAIGHLTRGFELWTYEDLRRDQVRRGELHAVTTTLVTADGASLRAFDAPAPAGSPSRAEVYVVDFIYTQCASICQTLGAEFYRMQEALRREGRGHVRLLSVSIDPARDTVPALKGYASLHRADGERWTIGAPTRKAALDDLTGALGVIAIPDGLGGYVHNGAIHVIDSAGVVLGIYDYDDWEHALRQARGRWPSPFPLPQAGEGERARESR
ncbi:MAG: SCO family protein [Rubrivivax sp.]|nr:MAG: SCO family protein [Rubrivivax sp.]